jgi:arginine/serine-rich splicing factor 17
MTRVQCLKPIARVNVSVQLPQLKKSGAKISNWEVRRPQYPEGHPALQVMEKIKEMGRPYTFPVFKVSKSSLEFIRSPSGMSPPSYSLNPGSSAK